jgi:hypothetical protein
MEPEGSGSVVRIDRLQEFIMENQMTTIKSPVSLASAPALRWHPDHHLIHECRNLIRILCFTIDSLCEDSEISERKLRSIQSLISSLSTLRDLAEEYESRIAGVQPRNFVDDFNGTRYYAVSTCELERFSEK